MDSVIQQHFQNVFQIIRQGKAEALLSVNVHLIEVNWRVGAYLSQQLPEGTYGDKIVSKLAAWVQEKEPGLKGYDRRSLYRMRVFYDTWQSMDWSTLPAVFKESKILDTNTLAIPPQKIVVSVTPQSQVMPTILLRVTWTHHIELLSKCASHEERLFYENPSIGVLHCKTKNDEVVEIAMSRQLSPALVAAYETKLLDKNLLRRLLHQWTENWELARETDARTNEATPSNLK